MRKVLIGCIVLMTVLMSSVLAASSVYISSINFDAPGNDHNNLNGEWVKITNGGSESVVMTGWSLSDEENKHVYRFPSFMLPSGSVVTVFTGSGTNTATRLYMRFGRAVWNNGGDTATLKDGSGNIIDRKSNR